MKARTIVSLIAFSLLLSCGKQAPSNAEASGSSANSKSQATQTKNVRKDVTAETKSKIEKWKKTTTRSSQRLSSGEFDKYDLSNFWITSYNLGYIGTNYQRMYITFEKAWKISSTEYRVEGFSQVKSNVCHFTGTIKNIEYNQDNSFGEDDCGENAELIVRKGCLIADFVLEEDANQKSTGKFIGMLEAYWGVDDRGNIHKRMIGCGDSERGEQYFGEWLSYKGGAKPVAWGVYRIPFSEELDMGASEFIPDEKYVKNGWDEYQHYR